MFMDSMVVFWEVDKGREMYSDSETRRLGDKEIAEKRVAREFWEKIEEEKQYDNIDNSLQTK